MEVNVAELKNKGMVRDYSISKSPDEYAFENLNIRITPNEDNTGLSITNEKGPLKCVVAGVSRKLIINKVSYSVGKGIIGFSLDYKTASSVGITARVETVSLHGLIVKIGVESNIYIREEKSDRSGYILFRNAQGIKIDDETITDVYISDDDSDVVNTSTKVYTFAIADAVITGVYIIDIKGTVSSAMSYNRDSFAKTEYFDIPSGVSEYTEPIDFISVYSVSLKDNVDYSKDDRYIYMMSKTYNRYVSDGKILPGGNVFVGDSLIGKYCGFCETSDSVVVFTESNGINNIYNISASESNEIYADLLYSGKLGITPENKVEALYRFESDNVRKVYWVDGVNQPRVINISGHADPDKGDTQFDFISTVDRTPKMEIRKEYNSSGLFPSGTIQYGVSYYNKFGSETNLLWFSTVHYITFEDRAAKADENVACQFRLNILNIDTKFDYVRVYSCIRTSIDSQPIVSIVGDYNISGRKKITVYDNNTNVTNVDPSLLYYIGGREFVASTIASKQDRLFLGDIKLTGDTISNAVKNAVKRTITKLYKGKMLVINDASMIGFDYKSIGIDMESTSYPYRLQTLCGKEYFSYFKYGEIYRFAIQFQTDKGSWTQPLWIGDKKCTLRPKTDIVMQRLYLPTATLTLDESVKSLVSGYRMYRVLIAETSTATRNTIAQGVLSPTMFSLKDRINNSPYVVSSWIMRAIGDVPSRLGDSAYLEIQSMDKDSKPSFDASDIGKEVSGESGTVVSLMFSWDIEKVKKYWAKQGADTNVSRVWHYLAGAFGNMIKYMSSLGFGWGPVGDWLKYKYCLVVSYQYTDGEIDPDSISIHCESRTSLNKMWSKVRSYVLRNLNTDIADDISKSDFKKLCKHSQVTLVGWKDVDNIDSTDKSLDYLKLLYNPNDDKGYVFREFSLWGMYKKMNIRTYQGESSAFANKVNNSGYFVDDSIVTFHSPDIEANQEFLSDTNLDMRIVGYVPITAGMNDVELDVSTKGLSDFASKSNLVGNIWNNISENYHTLVNSYLYEDSGWLSNDSRTYPSRLIDKYKIYMWHKSGSINGLSDKTYPSESGDDKFLYVPSEIKRKVFASKRFSLYDVFFDKPLNVSISNPSIIYDDNTAKALRACGDSVYYYGDVDTLLTRRGEITGAYVNDTGDTGYDVEYSKGIDSEVYIKSYDPIRIKYKSPSHVVFAMTDNDMTYYRLPEMGYDPVDTLPEGEVYPWVEPAWVVDEDYAFLGIYKSADSAVSKLSPVYSEVYKLKDKTLVVATPVGNNTKRYLEYYIISINGTNLVASKPDFTDEDESDKGQDVTDIPMRVYRLCQWDLPYTFPSSKDVVMLDDLHNMNWRKYGDTIKYKQLSLKYIDKPVYPYLYLAELYREIPYDSLYGGYDENQIERLKWIVSSSPYPIYENIPRMGGDTYYQRWDCLKTYPYSEDDSNSVVDITSFMVETHTLLDGRCDTNRRNSKVTLARPTNYNLFNQVYNQTDNLFSYNILDDKYDLDTFGNQVVWSNAKIDTDEVDSWTNINMLSSLNLDGSKGDITKLINLNDSIVAFQDKAVSVINYNNPTQISTESGNPIEVVNSGLVNGYSVITAANGCQNKWSVCKGGGGVYFIDDLNKSMLSFNKDGLSSVSAKGFSRWFKDNIDFSDRFNIYYDALTRDVYIVNSKICLSYNEELDAFSSFYSYEGMKDIFNINGNTYAVGPSGNIGIHRMFGGNYGETFDGRQVGWGVTYKANPEPMTDKIFTNLEYTANVIDGNVDDVNYIEGLPLRSLSIWNEYQKGSVDFTKQYNALQRDNARMFRLWRVQLPRDEMSKNRLDRIRNTWCYIKLSDDNPLGKKVVLHNVMLKYYK